MKNHFGNLLSEGLGVPPNNPPPALRNKKDPLQKNGAELFHFSFGLIVQKLFFEFVKIVSVLFEIVELIF